MNVYTTEQVINMGAGTMVIGLGTGWCACHGVEFKGLTPNHKDMRCQRLDGKHVGDEVVLFQGDDKRRWIPYNEMFEVDEENSLNELIGKKVRLKAKKYGEIVQGILGNANSHHVVLKIYTNIAPSPNWVRSEDGETRKPYYIRPLGENFTDPDLWELVSEA